MHKLDLKNQNISCAQFLFGEKKKPYAINNFYCQCLKPQAMHKAMFNAW